MVQAPKKTWIAHVNSLTVSIRCDGAWTSEINVVNRDNRVNNKANRASRVSKDNKVNKDSAASRGNRARRANKASRVNKDNQVNNKVNNRVNNKVASNPAARRTVATVAATGNMLAHSGDRWAVTGVTTANFPPKCASDFAKPRTCDASGAQLD